MISAIAPIRGGPRDSPRDSRLVASHGRGRAPTLRESPAPRDGVLSSCAWIRSVTPEVAGSSPSFPLLACHGTARFHFSAVKLSGAEPYEKYNGMPSALERPLDYLVHGV
jgi:hypothetical protein